MITEIQVLESRLGTLPDDSEDFARVVDLLHALLNRAHYENLRRHVLTGAAAAEARASFQRKADDID